MAVTDTPRSEVATSGPASAVRGRVLSRNSHTPLAGLRIEVGSESTRSDDDGEFIVTTAGDGGASGVSVRVLDQHGRAIAEAPAGDGPVEMLVELPDVAVSKTVWKDLGRRARREGIDRINTLVAELASPDAHTFADWSLPKRQAVLWELEQLFLDPTRQLRRAGGRVPTLQALQDPEAFESFRDQVESRRNGAAHEALRVLDGKTRSFHSLGEVDWPLDVDAFVRGDERRGLLRFADNFLIDLGVDEAIYIEPPTSKAVRYRDYLRAIWTTNAATVVASSGKQLTEKQAREQLESRFHQDFRTYDDAERPANEVVIPILRLILVAPTGPGFGFGVAAASIAAQGNRTAREYLDYLIGLSGVSATELRFRYRVDLERPDTAVSSPVKENIAALQGFFTDTFQSGPEPYGPAPDVLGQGIVASVLQGNAPFFLHYDEWLREQQTLHGENFLDIRKVLRFALDAESRKRIDDYINKPNKSPNEQSHLAKWQLIKAIIGVADALNEGHGHFYNGEFPLARVKYEQAHSGAINAFRDSIFQSLMLAPKLKDRIKNAVTSMPHLKKFQEYDLSEDGSFVFGGEYWEDGWRDLMALRLAVYALYVIPICRGDAELALGDYQSAVFHYGQASRLAVGMAHASDSGGYRPVPSSVNYFPMYAHGDLPFTVDLREPPERGYSMYPTEGGGNEDPIEFFATKNAVRWAHAIEKRLFKLRQGTAMLEWADALHRSDNPSSIRRARELYKGLLWLWGETPPIKPRWPEDPPTFLPPFFLNADENPAITSQKERARLGIYKIGAGLNYFGERDDVVPVLRYRPLKETADRTAALAKGAQLDFLHATEKVENALAERMRLSTLVQKATLQASIGVEQIEIAKADVQIAQDQVAAVQAAIAAKEAANAKADSYFSQLGDFIGGMKDFFTAMPGDAKSALGTAVMTEGGDAMVSGGLFGMGAGATVTAGYAAFAVAGTMTLTSMRDAAYAREGELRAMKDKALPAAQRVVVSRQHAQRIAELQTSIARADLDLAQRLIAFEENKLLNLAFWVNLAQVAKRLLRRYLDLGARMAWLAERALAYEQDRALNIVRLDYHVERLQNVTGPDLLQLDLAELEATRIEGLKRTMPVTRSISLARDLPLAFGQLKATGRCDFRTQEAEIARAYPGTTGYRIRAVSVLVSQLDFTSPLRGTLLNQGVSISKPGTPEEHALVRPTEALPLSEFRLRGDMGVYGLPDETLLPFEGSGIETFWQLELPVAANSANLASLADVVLTFDLRAQFDPQKRIADLQAMETSIRRWVMMSAAVFDADALASLRAGAPTTTIEFDIRRLGLPRAEKARKVANVVVFLIDPKNQTVKASLAASSPATTINVTLDHGTAMSGLQPLAGMPKLPAAPLDKLAGAKADQRFRLTIDKAANAGVNLTGVRDAVLAVEYTADL